MNIRRLSRATINKPSRRMKNKFEEPRTMKFKVAAMANVVDLNSKEWRIYVDNSDTPSSKTKGYAEIKGTVNVNSVPYDYNGC